MIGKRIGQYEILEEIGSGGMGTVYRARQISLRGADQSKGPGATMAIDKIKVSQYGAQPPVS